VVRNTLNHEVTVPGLAGLAKLSGQIKQVGLTGSPFHFVQEQLQAARLGMATDPAQTPQLMGRALANGVNPAAYKSWLTTPAIADVAAHAASDGVTFGKNAGEAIDLISGVKGMAIRGAIGGVGGAVSTYGVQRARGVPEEEARNQAILAGALGAVSAGPLGAVIGPATFERQIPTLKILGYKMLTDGGVAGPDAASMVNNQFGGQNLNRMARDPNFQAILRSVALAPDWWESWFRNAGTAIPGVPVSMTAGNAARKNVAVTVAGAAMTLEGLNYLFTGHGTADNAPNHQLDLEIPASMIPGAPQGSQPLVHVDVLGPLKPLAQVAVSGGDIGAFVKSRLSAPAGFAVGALQNKNPVTGAPLVQPGTPPLQAAGQYAASELGSVMPAGAQGIMQGAQAAGPAGAALAGLSGLRVSASSAQPVSKPVQAELDRLHKLGYTGVSLPYPDASFIIGNSRIDLTADERRQLASLRGSIVDPMITKTMQSPAWSTATDDAKANYIQTLSEQASTLAKQRLLASLPSDVRSQRLQAGLQVRGRLVTSR
jgi:hypothetical protein